MCINDLLRLCFVSFPTCSLSPAVGKVGMPRRGHPLVEFVIESGMDCWKKEGLVRVGDLNFFACSCIHMAH